MSSKILDFFVVLAISTIFLSCNHVQTNQGEINQKAKLQILYFHSTFRCPTCNAIENNTKKVLNERFKSQMDDEILNFASFTIEKKENRALIEKYQISYTHLLLVKADGTITDFTYTAFEYAYGEPAKYEALLKDEIDKNLK
jgi:hypothetical protein